MIYAVTPDWVLVAKDYLALGASFVAALGLVFRYAVKPFFEHQADERRREIADALAPLKAAHENRQREMFDAIRPIESRVDRLADALAGINGRLDVLTREQTALHSDVREHMRVEDELRKQQGDSH